MINFFTQGDDFDINSWRARPDWNEVDTLRVGSEFNRQYCLCLRELKGEFGVRVVVNIT